MFTHLRTRHIGKALTRTLLHLHVVHYRSYSHDKHHTVQHTPYGGGADLLLLPTPLLQAMDGVNQRTPGPKRDILLDPAGKLLHQQAARTLSQAETLVFICGTYTG